MQNKSLYEYSTLMQLPCRLCCHGKAKSASTSWIIRFLQPHRHISETKCRKFFYQKHPGSIYRDKTDKMESVWDKCWSHLSLRFPFRYANISCGLVTIFETIYLGELHFLWKESLLKKSENWPMKCTVTYSAAQVSLSNSISLIGPVSQFTYPLWDQV